MKKIVMLLAIVMMGMAAKGFAETKTEFYQPTSIADEAKQQNDDSLLLLGID